jgi:glycosyltransferase involved in cell wall biosynthesis
MKKIAIIGTVGLPANYGGFETLAHHLVKNLSHKFDFTVYCSSKKYAKSQRTKKYLGAKLKYLPFNANGVQSVIYDSVSILHAILFSDVLLILGVAGAWLLPFVRLFTRKRIIISIDGIEWKRDKWNTLARMYLWWAEKIAVKYAHIDISDNESIQDYTALRYQSLSRVIEYGGDHARPVSFNFEDQERYQFLGNWYAIKTCRIEPENNIQMILRAFVESKKYKLVMIGNWNNSAYGRSLREEYCAFENIVLLDPIYDQGTLDVLRSNASLYVHGHSAGGTNPSLVEAMSLGLPVLSYNVCYNRTTTENKAAFFASDNDIVSFLNQVDSACLNRIAISMKEIAQRRYCWELIAKKYDALIEESLLINVKQRVFPAISNVLSNQQLLNHKIAHLRYQVAFYEKPNSIKNKSKIQ